MSVDLSDPNVSSAYEDILKSKGKDWLLLSYGQTRDKLTLYATGEGDVTEFRARIEQDPDEVFFGFVRVLENGKSYYALIAYVPETVSGVRRARALVHSRAVGGMLKAHTVSFTVQKLETITIETLRERMNLLPSQIPRAMSNERIQRSVSDPHPPDHHHPPSVDSADGVTAPQLARFASEKGTPTRAASTSQATIRIASQHIPNARRGGGWNDELPPPTPPKDSKPKSALTTGLAVQSSSRSRPSSPILNTTQFSRSRSELAYLSDGDDNQREHSGRQPGSSATEVKPIQRGSSESQRAHPVVRSLSPEEKARQRIERQRQIQEEAEQAMQEEAERQYRLKQEKAALLRQAEEEDRQRLAQIERQKQWALAERTRREQERQREEERRLREAEEKRLWEKTKRMEMAKHLEEERARQERRMQDLVRKKEEERRQADLAREQKMKEIQRRYAHRDSSDPVLLSGNISVQTSTSISWKRRFFELTSNALRFYRDSMDRTHLVDVMNLSGNRIQAIREPHEGFDELEAIPHSFAVEFCDGDGPWCLYSDSAEDKDTLISLLSQAAGL